MVASDCVRWTGLAQPVATSAAAEPVSQSRLVIAPPMAQIQNTLLPATAPSASTLVATSGTVRYAMPGGAR